MNFTIVREDNIMVIDGVIHEIDLSGLPDNLHAVQWYDTTGEQEWNDETNNTIISDISEYQSYIDEHLAITELASQREIDPLYGYEGEELFNKTNEIDTTTARTTFYTDSLASVEVTLTEGTYTFNGGQESSVSIQGAIDLATMLSETTVTITDIDNIRRELSFDSANDVVSAIAKAYRDAFFIKQDALVEIASRVYEG